MYSFVVQKLISRSKNNNDTLETTKIRDIPKIETYCTNWIRFAFGCLIFENKKL